LPANALILRRADERHFRLVGRGAAWALSSGAFARPYGFEQPQELISP
jgi:hypothetical protein